MNLYKYKGEVFYEVPLFDLDGEKAIPQHLKLGTLSYEKATKFGFERHKKTKSWFLKWVLINSCQYVGEANVIERSYRVRYQGHFFRVNEETEENVKLIIDETNNPEVEKNIDFIPRRMAPSIKWVERSEIQEIKDIKERVCFYDPNKTLPSESNEDCSNRSDVFYILDENETHYLLREDTYLPKEKPCEVWIPKDDVFVYNETDEPLRY